MQKKINDCEWGTTKVCETCKLWVKSNKVPTLKHCVADNHIGIVGPAFFCANWEIEGKKK